MTDNPYEAPQTILSSADKAADAHARWQVIVRSMKQGARVGAFLPGGLTFAVGVLLLITSLAKASDLSNFLGFALTWIIATVVITLLGGILGGLLGIFIGLILWCLGIKKTHVDTS